MKRILAILFCVGIAGFAFGQSAASDILKYTIWECRLDDSYSNLLIFGSNNSVQGVHRDQPYETSGTYEIKGDSIIITERIVGCEEWYKLHGIIKDKELYFVYRRDKNTKTGEYDVRLQLDSTYIYRTIQHPYPSVMYKTLISIASGPNSHWADIGAIHYALLLCIEKNPKIIFTLLNELDCKSTEQFWYFIFDGPHPSNYRVGYDSAVRFAEQKRYPYLEIIKQSYAFHLKREQDSHY